MREPALPDFTGDYENTSEPHDVVVEREQIREANERNAMLQSLQAYLEQVRTAYERAKKTSER